MASLHLPSTAPCTSLPARSFSDQSHILFYSKASTLSSPSSSSSSSAFPFLSTTRRHRHLSSSSSSSSALLRHGSHPSSASSFKVSASVLSDPCPIEKDQESILQELADLKSLMKQKKKELKTLAKKKEKEMKLLTKKEEAGDCEESSSSSSSDEECCDQTVDMQELKEELGRAEYVATENREETAPEARGCVQTMEKKACKPEAKKMDKKKMMKQKKMENKKDCESSSSSSSESSDDEEDCRDQFVALKTLKQGIGFAETMAVTGESIVSVQSMATATKALPFSCESMELMEALPSCVAQPTVTAEASSFGTESLATAKASPFFTDSMGTAKALPSFAEFMDAPKSSLSCAVLEGSMESPRLAGTIQVCVGGKCKKAGSEKLIASLRSHLPADSGVEAIPCKCMGKCAMAINVKVQKLGEEATTQTARHSYVGAEDANLILSHHFGLVPEIASPPTAALSCVS